MHRNIKLLIFKIHSLDWTYANICYVWCQVLLNKRWYIPHPQGSHTKLYIYTRKQLYVLSRMGAREWSTFGETDIFHRKLRYYAVPRRSVSVYNCFCPYLSLINPSSNELTWSTMFLLFMGGINTLTLETIK